MSFRRVLIFVLPVLIFLSFGLISSSSTTDTAKAQVRPDATYTDPSFFETRLASLPNSPVNPISNTPIDLAFTPNGRLLITSKEGRLFVYQNGSLLTTPVLDISAKVCTESERGLVGLTVDPQFSTNRFIYLFYTFKKFNSCDTNSSSSAVNRVSRFAFTTITSNVVDPNSELVLLDNLPSPGGNHNGGGLRFGQDGLLYVSAGDGGCELTSSGVGNGADCQDSNSNARFLNRATGKMLRITADGNIPAGNPYAGDPTARRCADPAASISPSNLTYLVAAGNCKEMFAWGLRNPFRFAFRPGTNEFYINDVGGGATEEIDLGQLNADYGWNIREGLCATGTKFCNDPVPPGKTNPIYTYSHDTGCRSITGGAFVPAGIWASTYNDAYLYADYVCNTLFMLKPGPNNTYVSTTFATNVSSPLSMVFGPYQSTQALYYTSLSNNIYRVVSTTGNKPPQATATASPTRSPTVPVTVNFNATGSIDPEGGQLTYLWNFGDGATATTTTPTTSHTYTVIGIYYATLQVRDPLNLLSNLVQIRIDAGNLPPVPVFEYPAADSTFSVGEVLTLRGSASDPNDGALPASSLTWKVLRQHGTLHTHPWLDLTQGNNITTVGPEPEDVATLNTSYLIVTLTATDSQGLSTTITRNILPKAATVTFSSVPSGLPLTLETFNTGLVTTPYNLQTWAGHQVLVIAPLQATYQAQPLDYAGWSAGSVTVSDTLLTATSIYTATAGNNLLNVTYKGLPGNCIPLVVTKSSDDGADCGTLRFAIGAAAQNEVIGIAEPLTSITLTDTLLTSKNLNIMGRCGPSGPVVTLNGAGLSDGKAAVQLQSGVLLHGLNIFRPSVSGSSGNPLAATGLAGNGGNQLSCLKARKT